MSLPIGTALKDGFAKTASRAGAILIAAYLVVNVVYLVAVNSTVKAYFTQNAMETQDAMAVQDAFPLAVDIPLAVGSGLSLVSLLVMVYVSMVAMRTFVADARDSFENVDLTGGIVLAFLNLLVGGIVQGILVFAGTIALVIPGIFLAISFVFMQFYIVVEGDNFVRAMKRSWRLTEGNRFSLFALGAVVLGVAFAIGAVFGIGSLVAMLAGLDQSVINVLQMVVIVPLSLYSIAVLASAFNLLREESDERAGGVTTADTPSTLA